MLDSILADMEISVNVVAREQIRVAFGSALHDFRSALNVKSEFLKVFFYILYLYFYLNFVCCSFLFFVFCFCFCLLFSFLLFSFLLFLFFLFLFFVVFLFVFFLCFVVCLFFQFDGHTIQPGNTIIVK